MPEPLQPMGKPLALKQYLEDERWTLTLLAKRCHLSISYVWRIVHGKQVPTERTMHGIADVVGLDVHDAFPEYLPETPQQRELREWAASATLGLGPGAA